MRNSVNEAKKGIWLHLQALVGDDEFWESTIIDEDWNTTAFEKARWAIFDQLERKL